MITVTQWPTSINVATGILTNPNPDQCRAAGYELYVPPTPPSLEEIEAAQTLSLQALASEYTAQVARTTRIEALRENYRATTRQFCELAGLTPVDKLDTPEIQAAILAAGQDMTALPLTQLAFMLFVLITDLRRATGADNAWDSI